MKTNYLIIKILAFLALFGGIGSFLFGYFLEKIIFQISGEISIGVSVILYLWIFSPGIKFRNMKKESMEISDWKEVSEVYNMSSYIPFVPPYFPLLFGKYKGLKILSEVRAERVGNTDNSRIITEFKAIILNPEKRFLLIHDRNMPDNTFSIFNSPLYGITENKELERRFKLSSNPEKLIQDMLQNRTLTEKILSIENFSLRISGNELNLASLGLAESKEDLLQFLDFIVWFIDEFKSVEQRLPKIAA